MKNENLSQFGKQEVQSKKEQENKIALSEEEEKLLRKKVIGGKIVIVVSAIICVCMVIFILAKSSQFFAYMFSLDTQKTIKSYLKLNYTSYMSALYFSIFGLVITIADTILFFFKFSQKTKLIWFHVGYYLAVFIVVIVAVSNSKYNSYMSSLKGHQLSDIECINASFSLQCSLSSFYLAYRGHFVAFFIVFSIFFAIYTATYHYYVLYIVPFQAESSKQQDENKSVIFNNVPQQNQTFVSEMFDQYGN